MMILQATIINFVYKHYKEEKKERKVQLRLSYFIFREKEWERWKAKREKVQVNEFSVNRDKNEVFYKLFNFNVNITWF